MTCLTAVLLPGQGLKASSVPTIPMSTGGRGLGSQGMIHTGPRTLQHRLAPWLEDPPVRRLGLCGLGFYRTP